MSQLSQDRQGWQHHQPFQWHSLPVFIHKLHTFSSVYLTLIKLWLLFLQMPGLLLTPFSYWQLVLIALLVGSFTWPWHLPSFCMAGSSQAVPFPATYPDWPSYSIIWPYLSLVEPTSFGSAQPAAFCSQYKLLCARKAGYSFMSCNLIARAQMSPLLGQQCSCKLLGEIPSCITPALHRICQ